jgi:hypothetical protein
MEALEKRLHDGFARIGEAMQRGVAVPNWERTWVELLREYEAMNDALAEELAARPMQQTEMPGLPRKEAA